MFSSEREVGKTIQEALALTQDYVDEEDCLKCVSMCMCVYAHTYTCIVYMGGDENLKGHGKIKMK